MKKLRVIRYFLATLLVVSSAVAQTAGARSSDDLSGSGEIAAARTKYLEKAVDEAASDDSQTEAQLQRRGPGRPVPRRGYYRGGYPTPWMANGDPGHALIGAGIGFAIGATIGAVGAVHNGTPIGGGVFIGGSLFALLGAAVGASHGAGHPFMHRRTYPGWPEEDEEGHLRSPAVQKNSRDVSASGKPALPSQPRETQARTAASPELPRVPEEPSVRTVSSPKTQQWQNFSGQLKPW